MTTVRIFIARVRAVLNRRRLEHELDEELRSHLELSTAEHVRRGLSPKAARGPGRGGIGVRMALGARAVHVVLLVQRRALVLIAAGLGIGLVSAAALSRTMSSVLFELSAGDPATFAAVTVILATVALAAGCFPARRAARVDPLVALRCD